MAGELLLVGSIPLDTAEEVFRIFGPGLGKWLDYLPDGEIGDRRYWIDGIAFRVLHGHPEIETVKRPAPDEENGADTWRPKGLHDQFQFKVKPGIKRVRFGDAGWRLGYTRDAINSYFVFRQLKKDGVIPAHMRFQVSIPLTYSLVGSYFPDPEEREKVVPGMNDALRAEVAEMCRHIPADELAIQWDLAVENRLIEPHLAAGDREAALAEAKRTAAPLAEVGPAMPDDVAMGLHSCYGTLDGWPSRQPKDITGTVIMLNAMAKAGGHRLDWVHFPTIAAADDAFFAPLGDLEVGGARSYVGAIHHMHAGGHMDNWAGLAEQLTTVKKYLPDFGLAAPCGFGRAPERPGRLLTETGDAPPPDYIQVILDDHMKAVEVLEGVLG